MSSTLARPRTLVKGRRLPWWRRHWRGLAAGAAVLVIVLPSVAQAAQERHRLAGLADVPGVVDPLGGPPHELWSDLRPDPATTHEVGGVLVGTWRSETEGAVARGVDAQAGTAVWSLPLAGPHALGDKCALADGAADGPRRAMLACVVVDEAPAPPVDHPDASTSATKVHLAVIDPRTGHVIATYPATPTDTISSLGTDIAIGSVVDGPIEVTRFDPRTGRTVWTAHPTSTSAPDVALTWASVSSSGDGLLIDAGALLWELSAAGAVVHEWSGLPMDDGWSIRTTPGGHVLRTTYAPSGGGTTTTDLGTGATIVTPPGQQVMTGPDDGSAPMLLLTSGLALAAWDLATGDSRWTTDGAVSAVVVLDGTVNSVGAGALRAQDAQTGAVRWTVHVGAAASTSLETDGRSLLVLDATAASAVSLLRAVDLQDGSSDWTSSLTGPPGPMLVLAHHLFTTTDDGHMVALG
jgi:hypothetical protein